MSVSLLSKCAEHVNVQQRQGTALKSVYLHVGQCGVKQPINDKCACIPA